MKYEETHVMSIVHRGDSLQTCPIPETGTGARHAASPAPLETLVRELQLKEDLTDLGVSNHMIKKLETMELATVLGDGERIEALVYGRTLEGFAALAATGKRVLFVGKEAMFVETEELSYDTVSGISHGKVGLFSTITLHTYLSDYQIRTPNWPIARHFIDFIEHTCLEKQDTINQVKFL